MKISYRIVSLILTVIMVISLCACSNGKHDIQLETTGVGEPETIEDDSKRTSDDITIRLHYFRDVVIMMAGMYGSGQHLTVSSMTLTRRLMMME